MDPATLLSYEFMRNALAAGLLCAIPCGAVGALIVVNRIVFLSEGVAHSAFGGIGLALLLGASPLLGATVASLAVALGVGWIALNRRHRADAAVGVFMSVSMAFGLLCMDLTPGYRGDPMAWLFGSILTVSRADLAIMAGLTLLILALVGAFYRPILAVSYDPDFARSRGLPVDRIWLLMMALVALAVLLVVRVAGLVLFVALVSIPPYVAERHCRTLAGLMAASALLAAFAIETGLVLAAWGNWTAGATITLVAGALFFLDALAAAIADRRRAV